MEMNIAEFLQALTDANCPMSATGGIVTFDDGSTFNAIDALKPVYAIVQEGGSTGEMYLHGYDTRAQADEARAGCADEGSYRTSPVVELPGELASYGSAFEAILVASTQLGYPEEGDEVSS